MSSEAQAFSSPRSGEQFTLASGRYRATIAAVGATLRSLECEDRALVVPFEADEVRPQSRGALLAPWPNRIADGRYTFDGTSHQLALSEPARRNAIHGLVGWLSFAATTHTPDRLELSTHITAQPGYPFQVRVTVEFVLDAHGLTQSVTGTNLGVDPAPWGVGFHPYLVADGTPAGRAEANPINGWTLSLPAQAMLRASEDRLLPLGIESLDAHPAHDFRAGRPIGATRFDHAFTGLGDADGETRIELRAPSGIGVGMAWGSELPWVQVYSSDGVAGSPTHRHGLAVEPMTCPPDAFNSGTDLVTLRPGGAHTVRWRVFAL